MALFQSWRSGHYPDITTLDHLPGREIERYLGLVQYSDKGFTGNFPKKSGELFQGLLNAASDAGGDAVINMRVSTGSYQAQGSQWVCAFVIVYGEAVRTTSAEADRAPITDEPTLVSREEAGHGA